mmetsp:Transcript_48347/g.102823  ORF Transcript_48347/g.102823 Transcript_48347/m.102823 type:complete len:236 (+) Transcript_48347:358-1065(+)
MISQVAPRHRRRDNQEKAHDSLQHHLILHLDDRLHHLLVIHQLVKGNVLLGVDQKEVHERVHCRRHGDPVQQVGVPRRHVPLPGRDGERPVERDRRDLGIRSDGRSVQVPEGFGEKSVAGPGSASRHGRQVGDDLDHVGVLRGGFDGLRERGEGLVGEHTRSFGEGEGRKEVERGGRIVGRCGGRVILEVEEVGVLGDDVRGVDAQGELRRRLSGGVPHYFSDVDISCRLDVSYG